MSIEEESEQDPRLDELARVVDNRDKSTTLELLATCKNLLASLPEQVTWPEMKDITKAAILVEIIEDVTTRSYTDFAFWLRTQQARDLVGISESDPFVVSYLKSHTTGHYRTKGMRYEIAGARDRRNQPDGKTIARHEGQILHSLLQAIELFLGDKNSLAKLTRPFEQRLSSAASIRPSHLHGSDICPAYSVSDEVLVSVLQGGGWAKTLEAVYDELPLSYPLLSLEGRRFPIWAELASEDEWDELQSPLGTLDLDYDPPFKDYSQEGDPRGPFDPAGKGEYWYLHETADDVKKYNGTTYTVKQIRRLAPGRLRLDCGLGFYFESLATSEVLDAELMSALARSPDQPVSLNSLPRRERLHLQLDNHDPVSNGRLRAGAVSVAATMICAVPPERKTMGRAYRALLIPRSLDVATHPLFHHVAPSGIFSALDWPARQYEAEFDVKRNILREYAEELYDYSELHNTEEFEFNLYSIPPVKRLLAAEEQPSTLSFHYCGISVNLMTLRPEICVLILVRDPTWFDREIEMSRSGLVDTGKPFKLNWEYLSQKGMGKLPKDQKYVHWLWLDENFRPLEMEGIIHPASMVPNAAAALHLSTQVARRVIQR